MTKGFVVERTVRINTAIRMHDENFKLSGLFTTQIFYIQLCREVSNARCDYFLGDIQGDVFSAVIGWRNRHDKWVAFKKPKFRGRRYLSQFRRSQLAAPPPELYSVPLTIPPAMQAITACKWR